MNHRDRSAFLAFVISMILLAGTARATVFWQADTNRGTAVFAGLDLAPGTVTVAHDPLGQNGNVYKFFLPDTNSAFGKERCESSGTENPGGSFLPAYNTEYYVGWRAMWSPMPVNGSWVALFQMHGYGVTGQGAPLVLRCVNGDGNLYMQNNANGVDTNFWHTKFLTNVWQSFVVHVFLSTNFTQGYTEIWYNGVLQTNTAGTTRWYGPTWDNVDGVWSDSYNKLKWGCYRSGSLDGHGLATAYMSNAKVGSTFADVNPDGGGDFSMTTAPSSQFVAPGGGVNCTVTIGALAGFSTNVVLSARGLPAGATANFSPATVTNSGNSTMSISTSLSTPVGSYPVSIIGTSGTLAHTNTLTLVVAGFTLSAAPSAQTVNVGSNATFTVTVTTNASFAGNINLGIGGAPADVSASFAPPALNQSGVSTLTIFTTTNTAGGSYLLTLCGTNGSLVATTTATITLNALQAAAGVLVWTNGAGSSNWSGALNWTNTTGGGYGPPGISNSVVFTNYNAVAASALTSPGSGVVVPSRINSSINGDFSIISLTDFANAINASPNYQNLGIAAGATLTVGNGLQVGGYGNYDFGANNVVNMSICGAGATLLLTNGAVAVCEGSGSGGAHDATLDLSGLDNFVMNGSQIKMGVENNTRSGGILYLAKTNTLTLSSAGYVNTDGSGSPYSGNPALTIGHNKSALGNGAQLYLGVSNSIAADYVTVGRGDASDVLAFNPAFLPQNPSVTIQGLGGAGSPVGVYVVGDDSPGAGGAASGTNDFSGGTVNALIDYLCVARGRQGANDPTVSSGILTFNNGGITANTLVVGFIYPSGSNSVANGTVNVNGTGTLMVMTNLTLASRPNSGGSGSVQGTLNVNGGTVEAANIVGGGGTAVINLNSGTMGLQPDWAPASGTISNISTLNIGAGGGGAPALLTGAGLISTANALVVASNGIISGNAVIITPTLTVNGALSPGNDGAGAMTNSGAMTFGTGGSYVVTVDDATAGPAAGWSFLQSAGGISVQSTSGNPFVIAVGTAGNPAANFNSSSNYDWAIAAANSGFTNFAPDDFLINSTQFQNDLGGGHFYIHTNGNLLVLSFTNDLPPVAPPVTVNISAPGMGGLIFSGTNGNAGAQYHVLASTNLALALSNWTVIATNNFDGNGNFNFTNPPDPAAPMTFYRLQF
ncbi:MAG TPA: hypothetical protein VK815_13685 [Candidatus Acidoferrales bacterium]|jgi:hypothetical protein|nr:hypothetical protein [Candidatus Acidoferrales bacterium]